MISVLHEAGMRCDNVDYLDSKRRDFRKSRAAERWLLLQRHRTAGLRAFFCQSFTKVFVMVFFFFYQWIQNSFIAY